MATMCASAIKDELLAKQMKAIEDDVRYYHVLQIFEETIETFGECMQELLDDNTEDSNLTYLALYQMQEQLFDLVVMLRSKDDMQTVSDARALVNAYFHVAKMQSMLFISCTRRPDLDARIYQCILNLSVLSPFFIQFIESSDD